MAILANAVGILGIPVFTDISMYAFIVVETGNEFVHLIHNIEVAGIILDEGTKEEIINILGEVTCN